MLQSIFISTGSSNFIWAIADFVFSCSSLMINSMQRGAVCHYFDGIAPLYTSSIIGFLLLAKLIGEILSWNIFLSSNLKKTCLTEISLYRSLFSAWSIWQIFELPMLCICSDIYWDLLRDFIFLFNKLLAPLFD